MFLLYGFYYIFRKYLSQYKYWFFILLAAMLCFKASNYTQALFFVFIIFTVLNIHNNSRNYYELIYCTIAGILLFFIKVNYGIIVLFVLLGMALFLLIKNRKSFVVFLLVSVLFSGFICFYVRIDLINYVRYSLLL